MTVTIFEIKSGDCRKLRTPTININVFYWLKQYWTNLEELDLPFKVLSRLQTFNSGWRLEFNTKPVKFKKWWSVGYVGRQSGPIRRLSVSGNGRLTGPSDHLQGVESSSGCSVHCCGAWTSWDYWLVHIHSEEPKEESCPLKSKTSHDCFSNITIPPVG